MGFVAVKCWKGEYGGGDLQRCQLSRTVSTGYCGCPSPPACLFPQVQQCFSSFYFMMLLEEIHC